MGAIAAALARTKVSLDESLPVVARRGFLSFGKRYERGDIFPWRLLGVHSSKLRTMFSVGLVCNAPKIEMKPDPIEDPKPQPKVAAYARDHRSNGNRSRT